MPIESGQELLHYRLTEKIGEGGMGQVWLALDTRLQRKAAVKFPSARFAADDVGLQRFRQEAQAAAAIDHPFVCKVYEVGRARGVDFIAMEYVEGATLSDELERGALPLERALLVAEEILEALAVAHERGIVHRDLKPANVMLAGGHVKVMDFGLARRRSQTSGPDSDTLTRLTQAGAIVGTLPYMSPEQLRGGDVDPRSDLFAFGVMLHEMLSGTHPFRRATAADTSSAILNEPPRSLLESNPELPAGLQPILDRLVAKGRDSRFATAAEAHADLRAVRTAASSATDLEPSRRLRTSLVIASLAVVVVAALLVAWGLLGARGRERARALLPEIQEHAEAGKYLEAYRLAERAEAKLGVDPELARWWPVIADRLTLVTERPGASVQLQAVPRPGVEPAAPVPVGTTPIEDLRLARADYRATIELAGHAPAERMISSRFNRGEAPFGADPDITLEVILTPAAEIPCGMVFVPGGNYSLIRDRTLDAVTLGDYYIDTFEVSNGEFAEFVQAGGYSDPSYWPASMHVGGRGQAFSEAVRTFTDRSGLQAPRGWSNQQFAAGRDDYPVTGVTWYEAAAYCTFRGKSLPDVFEWEKAARGRQYHFEGAQMPWGQTRIEEANLRANFLGTGTDPVHSHPFGISPYGAYNMAGNVEEWLANPRTPGYVTVGGSWTSPSYSFARIGARPADHAHESVGFRCVQPVDPTRERHDRLRLEPRVTLADLEPVDDETFRGFLSHYRYDLAPANAEILDRVETADWVREKIAFDGVSGDRALAYLWIPKRGRAPFQVINYVVSSTVFPSVGGTRTAAEEAENILAPQIKSGRAVLAVVPKGGVERPWDGLNGGYPLHGPLNTVGYRDEVVLFVTEYRMGLDYLETREEIDPTRIAHVGVSLGAVRAAIVLVAVEPRIRSTVFLGGGSQPFADVQILPEANPVNFAPRVRSPVLMINGLYDEVISAERGAKPMFALLPEPKRLELVEAGHLPDLEIRTPIINSWLDQTLGPVDSSPPSTQPVVSSLKIAVLPFVNASGDPAQEYFSNGLSSDIVTELSRYGELAVMPCRAGPCKGGDADAREVGQSLQVRYVLQGRVQSSSERIRVSVQLSDGRDGRSVWGDSFDRKRTARDLFDLQDDLTRQVVNAIAGYHGILARAELPRSRRKPPASLDSYDCVLRVYEFLQVHNHTEENHLAARECLERVVEAEPDYVDGLAWLALLDADQFYHRWDDPDGRFDSRERALELAERAVSLDDGNQLAHAHLGFAALLSGDSERGISEMHRAVELNPNNPLLLSLLANNLANQGDFELAVTIAERAIELNPHPPDWIDWPLFIDHYVHGRYEQALVHTETGLVAVEDFREPLFLAATLGQLGRGEEAAPVLDEFRAQWGELCKQARCEGLDIGMVRRELIERHAISEAITDRLIEGLLKAGLTEEKPDGAGG